MGWLSTFRARRKNQLGIHLREQGDARSAERAYRDAIRLDPGWEVPWFNLGLIHKERRDWPQALQCNMKAIDLQPENPPAFWNLGIAATALERWDLARMAWQRYGIPIADGEGPIDGDFGPVPIRLEPDGRGEVVWCDRLDPARARIVTVPLPESGRRWHDVLLHDGEPRGSRLLRGHEVPVFDEIQVLRSSDIPTFSAEVVAPEPEDAAALEKLFGDAGAAAEDWSGLRFICTSCSEGRAHDHPPVKKEWTSARTFGIASPDAARASELLWQWAQAGHGRSAGPMEKVL